MGFRQPSETLAQRANFLRESLQKSQSITEQMVSTLGSFDQRLSNLESAMRPTQVRTHGIRIAHENIDKIIKSSDIIIAQFDLSRQAEAKILKGPHGDLDGYLGAMDQLKKNVNFFGKNKSANNGSDGVLSHANGLLAKAVVMLEEEFRQLLSSCSKPVEPDRLFECLPNAFRSASGSTGQEGDSNGNTAVYTIPTLIPPKTLPLLRVLAKQLVQAGCQEQCLQMYRECRAPVLEQTLRKLGVEKCSKEDVQKMQWAVLEAKIGNWIHFLCIAVKLLFAGERTVCDQIFEGINSLKEQCFAEVTANSVATLLSFGDAVAKNKGSPEKLFVILDMYEAMRELKPEIETIFGAKVCTDVLICASNLTKHLAQTALETFDDFEEAVEKDASKTAVQDGTVHPLTSYVINYVKFLFDYQSTLKQLFQELETGDESNSQLATITMQIMQALQINLDGKSKQYKDPSLTLLFLMNNMHYMVRSVRRSEAKDFLGDDWVQRHRRIVQQNANLYKRVAWSKILQSLTIQGSTSSTNGEGSPSSGVSRSTVKQRFRSFNMQFDELYKRQTQWNVPDLELRESLKLSIAEILLPAYRSFIKRFGSIVSNGRSPHKYIKYTPEDLDRMLGDFFEGKASNEQKQ